MTDSDRELFIDILSCLQYSNARLACYARAIDYEFGNCRSVYYLVKDHDMPIEWVENRKMILELTKKLKNKS